MSRFQTVLGGGIFAYMIYVDLEADVDVTEFTKEQLIAFVIRYGLAFILLKNVSIAQVTELVRAWRGKE